MQGYIKLDRKMTEWEWYLDTNTKVLFLHMLFRANWKDQSFMGHEIIRGSFVSSINRLSVETGLSERQVRTAIKHLKSTGEVTSKSTNKFTVFTVTNYDKYQCDDKQNDNQATSKRQASDKQVTTIERKKESKKDKKVISNSAKSKTFTPPTQSEVQDYCKQRSNNVDPERFIDFYSAKGWMIGRNKMKDWKAAVRTWERKDKSNDPGRKVEPVKREKTWSEEAREIAEQYTGGFEGF